MYDIDLYQINDAAFVNRAECNSCPNLKDESCLAMDTSEHEECPFVEADLDDICKMEASRYRTLLVDFADEVMDLELSEEENGSVSVKSFSEIYRGLIRRYLSLD